MHALLRAESQKIREGSAQQLVVASAHEPRPELPFLFGRKQRHPILYGAVNEPATKEAVENLVRVRNQPTDAATMDAKDGVYCSTSGTVFTDKESLAEHYKSDLHRYNLKRKVAGASHISQRVRANGPAYLP